jgi:hypothetical protein
MNLRIPLLGAALAALLGACTAAAPTATGSLVIDGKTFNFSHGRAWRNGEMLGVPGVEVTLADAPLQGLDWWKQQEAIEGGQHGRVLIIKPSQVIAEGERKEPYRYVIEEGYRVSVSAPEFGNRRTTTMSEPPKVTNITMKDGWVEGEVTWAGEQTTGYDPVQKLSAYTARFRLPLDEIGDMPKQ